MITLETVQCPSCKSLQGRSRGPLPQVRPKVFGGTATDFVLEAGNLWQCIDCDLYFRFPYASQDALTAMYRELPETVWSTTKPRATWSEVARLCDKYAAERRILDVGCFAGDFLEWMSGGWEKLGIEPNVEAREISRRRGIEMVAEAIETVAPLERRPGVITMLDVIEHLRDPLGALRRLKSILHPRGSIVVLTGAADSAAWRFFRNDYWYCSLPEHVSFFTKRWFGKAAAELGMEMKECHYLSSVRSTPYHSVANLSRLILYTLVARLRRQGWPEPKLSRLPMIGMAARWTSVPWWQEAKDHLLVVLQRDNDRVRS